MKINHLFHGILGATLLLGFSSLNAQEGNSILDQREQLQRLQRDSGKILKEAESQIDPVRNALQNFSKETAPIESKIRAIAADPARAIPVSPQQLKNEISRIDPKTALDTAKRALNQGSTPRVQVASPVRTAPAPSTPRPRTSVNRTVAAPAPQINRGAGTPLLTYAQPEIASRSNQPIPSIIPEMSELFGPTPAPAALTPKYGKLTRQKRTANPDEMVITANEFEVDRNNDKMIFRGNVILDMDGMEMKCDHLLVDLYPEKGSGELGGKMKQVTATGGLVQVRRDIFEKGVPVVQVAKCRTAVHTAATKITTLSGGPPYLQNGGQYVNTNSEDSVITLDQTSQRYTVSSPKSPATGRQVLVVPVGNAGSLQKSLGLEDKVKIKR